MRALGRKGGAIRMAEQKIKILFVCAGNTCRSPMAKFLAKDSWDRNEERFSINSAGIKVRKSGAPMTPAATRALQTMGLAIGLHHCSQPAQDMDLKSFDHIVTLDASVKELLLKHVMRKFGEKSKVADQEDNRCSLSV